MLFMGFGSYDESEQETGNEGADLDEEEGVTVHEHDHDGDVSIEGGDDQDALLNRLQDMKD